MIGMHFFDKIRDYKPVIHGIVPFNHQKHDEIKQEDGGERDGEPEVELLMPEVHKIENDVIGFHQREADEKHFLHHPGYEVILTVKEGETNLKYGYDEQNPEYPPDPFGLRCLDGRARYVNMRVIIVHLHVSHKKRFLKIK